MNNLASQLLSFLQQGIAAIFKFVQLAWTWAATQVSALSQVSWQSSPLWKQIVLAIVVGTVIWALYKVVVELWEAGERILAAFAALLGVLVRTLPTVMVAGLVAFCGAWVINNMNLSSAYLPSFLQ